MRKNLIISILLSLLAHTIAAAQSYKYIYYLDNNLASTDSANAVFIAKAVPDETLIRADYFFKNGNVLLMSMHFTDSTLSNMTGLFRSFHLNGKLENEGLYKNNIEDGLWQKWDSSGHKRDSSIYINGMETINSLFIYDNAGNLIGQNFSDSINNKRKFIAYKSSVKIYETESDYKGDNVILKIYENGTEKIIQITKKDMVEASFPGGDQEYRRYLQMNLDANTPVEHGARDGTYQVVIRFMVNVDGSVTDVTAETHFGFGMEAEGIRIIKKCPNWKPATIAGYPVAAFRRSPITFVVQEN